jgi:glycosyltransferase involved in cell wall biosynthesis
MRIGILTHNFPRGNNDRQNAGAFVNDIARELALTNGVSVFTQDENRKSDQIGGVKVCYFSGDRDQKLGDLKPWKPADFFSLCLYFINGFRNLKTFLKTNKVEVNVAMWAFPSGVFAYLAKIFYKVPYVVWCLGSDIYVYSRYPVVGALIKRVLNSAAVLLADSPDLASRVTDISGQKCLFLPSASNIEFPDFPIETPKSPKIKLLMVARMEKIKGPDILLGAVMKLGSLVGNYEIHFVGSGSLLKDLQERTYQAGLKRVVFFHGNVNSAKEIGALMRRSDWLIIPSRSDSIPLVFSEAMKCRLPVVVADLPDLKYLVEHYRIGLVFKAGDILELIKLLRRLPLLAKERNRFVENTSKAALDFSIEESANKLFNLLSTANGEQR